MEFYIKKGQMFHSHQQRDLFFIPIGLIAIAKAFDSKQ
jgi:hypothetical protein